MDTTKEAQDQAVRRSIQRLENGVELARVTNRPELGQLEADLAALKDVLTVLAVAHRLKDTLATLITL